jgi:hypothetical protein
MKRPILLNAVERERSTGCNVGGRVTAERFNLMGKVLEFDARRLVRKDRPMPERGMAGKLIEFYKPKSLSHSRNAETRKPDEAIAEAMFFWSC